jgi:hypothetical protein
VIAGVELAGIGLGVGDKLGDGLGRNRRVDLHDQRHALDLADRRDVLLEIEVELFVERGVDRILRIDRHQRVAVGRHMGKGFGRDVAGGAGPGLDDELLVQPFRHEIRDQACDDVGGAAGRLADDHAHRARRIGALGARNVRRGWHCTGSNCKLQKATAINGHGFPPRSAFF